MTPIRRELARFAALAAATTIVGAVQAPSAAACGSFFCGQQPVDQLAERVIFAVNEDAGTTDMIVQIQFTGRAPDFAWIVPLGAVPLEGSLATFPQAAMVALDANSSPLIDPTGGCMPGIEDASSGVPSVTVHAREEVGPYDTAVVGSDDPTALIRWLRDNGFRVTTPMEPYIADYAGSGRVFLALRLTAGSDVADIEPFRMTLPGTSPAIPLRMTALAAEPEMGIVVTILGSQRYEPANWPSLEVPPAYLRFDPATYQSNWTAAVARVVDEAGGQGWVTEVAGPSDPYIQRLERSAPRDDEEAEARAALLELFEGRAYLTRLYTRLSAEEMRSDPIFRRSGGGDVSRIHEAEPLVDCSTLPDSSPCDFVACGAGGRCAEVPGDGEASVAGCACVPGATARTTRAPDGRVTVACVDRRMSFLNPGDREVPGATALPDPCVGFDCGAGTCVAMNMTPTCECDRGAVAIGSITEAGERRTSCVAPRDPIPASFYEQRLPEPREPTPALAPAGGGCSVRPAASPPGALALAGLALLGLVTGRRRRR